MDEGRVRAAVQARRTFNAIHLATMFTDALGMADLLERARAET